MIESKLSGAALGRPVEEIMPAVNYMTDIMGEDGRNWMVNMVGKAFEACNRAELTNKLTTKQSISEIAEITKVSEFMWTISESMQRSLRTVNPHTSNPFASEILDSDKTRIAEAIEKWGGPDLIPDLGALALETAWQADLLASCSGICLVDVLGRSYEMQRRHSDLGLTSQMRDVKNALESTREASVAIIDQEIVSDHDQERFIDGASSLVARAVRASRPGLAQTSSHTLMKGFMDTVTCLNDFEGALRSARPLRTRVKRSVAAARDSLNEMHLTERREQEVQTAFESAGGIQSSFAKFSEPFRPMSGKKLRNSDYWPMLSALTGHAPGRSQSEILEDPLDKIAAQELIGLICGLEKISSKLTPDQTLHDAFQDILGKEFELIGEYKRLGAILPPGSHLPELASHRTLAEQRTWLEANWPKVGKVLDSHWPKTSRLAFADIAEVIGIKS